MVFVRMFVMLVVAYECVLLVGVVIVVVVFVMVVGCSVGGA